MQSSMVRSGIFYIPRSGESQSKIFSPRLVVIGNLTDEGFLEDGQSGRRLRYARPSFLITFFCDLEELCTRKAPFVAFTPSIAHPQKTFKEFPHPTGIEAKGETQSVGNQHSINYETNINKIVECLILQSEGASGPKFESMGCQKHVGLKVDLFFFQLHENIKTHVTPC